MTHDEIDAFFTSRGWFRRGGTTAYYHPAHKNVRYAVKERVLRKELKLSNSNEWIRARSGTISQLRINDAGLLEGMVR